MEHLSNTPVMIASTHPPPVGRMPNLDGTMRSTGASAPPRSHSAVLAPVGIEAPDLHTVTQIKAMRGASRNTFERNSGSFGHRANRSNQVPDTNWSPHSLDKIPEGMRGAKNGKVAQTPPSLIHPKPCSLWLVHHGSSLVPPSPPMVQPQSATGMNAAFARMGIVGINQQAGHRTEPATHVIATKRSSSVKRLQKLERLRKVHHQVLFQYSPPLSELPRGSSQMDVACNRRPHKSDFMVQSKQSRGFLRTPLNGIAPASRSLINYDTRYITQFADSAHRPRS